ncbi:hypothetical protein [Eisenibacter elegans]|uniref:hypothetical protein n=1 Tax=Eisenibacter elegans TaxID=997 RepID=UPI00040A282A|nr:hypothetical protein [Eisenibacter elegans]
MEKLQTLPNAEILFDQEAEVMYLMLSGTIELEEYKHIFEVFLQEGIKLGSKRFVIQQGDMVKSSMAARAWLVAKWLPKVQKSIPECRAGVVLAKSLFTRIGGEYLVGAARKLTNFNVRTFGSLEDAQQWVVMDNEDVPADN